MKLENVPIHEKMTFTLSKHHLTVQTVDRSNVRLGLGPCLVSKYLSPVEVVVEVVEEVEVIIMCNNWHNFL